MLDETHDPALRSWVHSANGHRDFPIQNLAFGIFTPAQGADARGGVAIGDMILDLSLVLDADLLAGDAKRAAEAACGATLNPFFELDASLRVALRRALSALLREGADEHGAVERSLRPSADCRMQLPARIGDYTDFYACIHHATNVGKQFRPDTPLLPNYKHVPIGYHGRASSIQVSGAPLLRPNGQTKAPDAQAPQFGPCRRLDIETELGIWIGSGNHLGEPIPINEAGSHIAGYCLLNDWSARDIQAWEYQPLGPFLSKSFLSTISPWVVTAEALAPFRSAQSVRPEGDPQPLAYLWDKQDQADGALDINLEVLITSAVMRERGLPPHRLLLTNSLHLYWTPAQLVAHHTSGGCDLRPGDLLGSGTLSAPTRDGFASLLELAEGGRRALQLPSGEERTFLEDGDEIVVKGGAERAGFVSIGFGEARGTVLPARIAEHHS